MKRVRIGIIGLGKNTRSRHVPGFRAIDGVEIVGVCNRRSDSTLRAAHEFGIPKTFDKWEQLVRDDAIDAVMIGTWPYLHCPITLAALEHGKHVLTEARMACNLAEARDMLNAAKTHPDLVTQIVPSPFGLRAGKQVRDMLDAGFIGELREFVVRAANADFAGGDGSLHWRQLSEFSGINMLALGIIHETLTRWIPNPSWVFATAKTFAKDATRPDSVHVLTELPNSARGIYFLSGVAHHGSEFSIELFGSRGTVKYEFGSDRFFAGTADDDSLHEVIVPPERAGSWQVEADFIDGIRTGNRPLLTDFASGVRYMEFTEAVEQSIHQKTPITLPLA